MIKVKVSISNAPDKINLSQFLGNVSNTYKECKFYVNEKIKEADYWFIFDQVKPDDCECKVGAENVFFLTAEVSHPLDYYSLPRMQNHLKQFSKIYTCYESYGGNDIYTLPFLPWMINSNHGDSINLKHPRDYNYFSNLTSINKSKKISVFCSNRAATEAHRQRIRFVKSLKNHFKDKLDWFGNGINTLPQKWDGIAPYKYHIVLENHSSSNVITEKLYDAFLGLSYPIYYGAPNVSDFFSSESMALIDIKDLKSSIETIEKLIESRTWENSLEHIVESKNKCINEFNVYHRMAEICLNSNKNNKSNHKEHIKLAAFYRPYEARNLISKFSKLLIRAGNKGNFISMS